MSRRRPAKPCERPRSAGGAGIPRTRSRAVRSRAAARGDRKLKARDRPAVPFIDTWDLRYANRRPTNPQPTTQAVMFCLMDVSGSMDRRSQEHGEALLHAALSVPHSASYERTEWCSSGTTPWRRRWMSRTFSTPRETGGTVVSSALVMMEEDRARALSPRRSGTSTAPRPRTATTGTMTRRVSGATGSPFCRWCSTSPMWKSPSASTPNAVAGV